MTQSVLISIRPKWCELIASGKKTIEVRKTRPKLEPPFKCYIYCTKSTDHPRGWLGCYDHDMHKFGLISTLNIEAGKHMNIEVVSGKVIGEFVCDEIVRYARFGYVNVPARYMKASPGGYPATEIHFFDLQLSPAELDDYGEGAPLYGWHISDLKIYDEPKELKQFQIPTTIPARRVRQAPQSWCYIEEVE